MASWAKVWMKYKIFPVKISISNIVHLSRVHSSHMQSLPGVRWWEEESEKSLEEESEIILGGAGFDEKEWEPVW